MTLTQISEVAEIERLCFSHPWSEESIKDSKENRKSYLDSLGGDYSE